MHAFVLYADAQPFLLRWQAIYEQTRGRDDHRVLEPTLGTDHREVADPLSDLVGIHVELGRYADAEAGYKLSLEHL